MHIRLEWKCLGVLAMTVAACAALASCSPKNSPDPFGGKTGQEGAANANAMTGASEQVQAVYKQRCLSCHGNALEGKIGPTTNLQKVGGRLSKEQIVKQINSGGNGMPGFAGQIKPDEVEALASWLAEKK
ncbi:c-type cytochrome [Paenibacillus allorhizosphaerae]|uniref:Cytochrome c-551 n=1 Tax=Paenibacillus allorhizosphaerae TaxID=2849866 RepID=A0ABM8VMJ7_9BACL|nr:cytochrome c [Paenibacillus allorhizosphaerae]CAG7649807.1 Cytochrome c-551 [Paenibacillus allorhizosphaerae]